MSTNAILIKPEEESLLLEQLRVGGQAFETLVRTYSSPLLASARRMLGQEEDARAAVRDAFLSAKQSLDRFQGQCGLGIWLQRQLIQTVLARQGKPERSIEDLLPKFMEDGSQAQPGKKWRVSTRMIEQKLNIGILMRQAIGQIPEAYRGSFWLCDIEGWDLETAAELLELNAALVKTRLHRARQALIGLLDTHFQGATP